MRSVPGYYPTARTHLRCDLEDSRFLTRLVGDFLFWEFTRNNARSQCGRRLGPQPHTTRTLSHLDALARGVHIRSQPTRRAPGCTSFVSLFPAPPCARAPANSTCLTRSKRVRDSARVPSPFLGASNYVCAGTSWRENENTAMGTVRRGMRTMHRGTTATPPSDIYLAHDAGVAHLKFAARTSCGVVGAGEKEECGGAAAPTLAHPLLGCPPCRPRPARISPPSPNTSPSSRRPRSLPQCPIPLSAHPCPLILYLLFTRLPTDFSGKIRYDDGLLNHRVLF
ncbi:hypothetical protein B0H13DRAFT_140310 [Mycena leptocephala]|nr:hypothetical protein B0H13DRAFT_140310 [Mycena leptocephala]